VNDRANGLVASRPLREALHRRLLAAPFDPAAIGTDDLRARLTALLHDEAPLVTDVAAARVLDELVAEVDGLGPLQSLLADPAISEIMVNGPNRVFVERDGRIVAVERELDAGAIVRIVERVIAPLGLRLDRASPMVDARLADGSRLHAVLPPLAPDGPCLTIRRFTTRAVGLADFGLNDVAVALLETMVRAGWNIVVSGATSAGKTTCANALAHAIDPSERVVTIEETAELRLDQPHVVRLETRPANAEGAGAVGVRELVRASLRMRPDRLVIGEVRGGEAFDMLQALNTGHDGSVSTIHANSPADALARLETLVLLAGVALPLAAVRAQVSSAVDAIVQVARGDGGARVVVAVAEVGPAREGEATDARLLLVREYGDLVGGERPSRRPRRIGFDLEEAWCRCVRSSSR
jgi:pilus assembly protein CpaF